MGDIRDRLGAHVRQLREARGLTQGQLAERADLSEKQIGAIERAETTAGIDTLEKLAIGLKIDVAELFGPSDRLGGVELSEKDFMVVREALDSLDQVLPKPGRIRFGRRPARRKR